MNARALAVTMLLLAGPVVAATPFGGDDTGFIPPSKGVFVCASKTQQLAGKLVVGYTKSHIRLAAAGSPAMPPAARRRVARKRAGRSSTTRSATCSGPVARSASSITSTSTPSRRRSRLTSTRRTARSSAPARHRWATTTRASCLPTTAYKCEAAVAKGLAALRYCLAKCHTKYAKSVMAGAPIDEEACESTDPVRSCRARFNRVRDRVAGICPGCLDATAQDALATGVEADVDQTNDTFYCASPSGAFVER
jgi:hypothetical protein